MNTGLKKKNVNRVKWTSHQSIQQAPVAVFYTEFKIVASVFLFPEMENLREKLSLSTTI